MTNRLYVGCKVSGGEQRREVFRSGAVPTFETHGERFAAVIGPFRTRLGAEFMARYGAGNPHCQCVAQAERLARKQYKEQGFAVLTPLAR